MQTRHNYPLYILVTLVSIGFGYIAAGSVEKDDIVSYTRVYLHECELDAYNCIGGTVTTSNGVTKTIDDCGAQCGLSQYDVKKLVQDWKGKTNKELKGLIITLPAADRKTT